MVGFHPPTPYIRSSKNPYHLGLSAIIFKHISNVGGEGTLVSNWVKVADKDKIVKILKFVKIGLKLLLDIGLEA